MEFILMGLLFFAALLLVYFQYKEDQRSAKLLNKEDIRKLEKSLEELDDMQKELLRVLRDQNVTKHS